MLRLLLPYLLLALAILVAGVGCAARGRGLAEGADPMRWLPVVSAGLLLVTSWLALRRPLEAGPGPRVDLFRRIPVLRRVLRHPAARPVGQLVFAVLFVDILLVGFLGSDDPARNPAPLLTWTIWWGGLALLTMFAGKAWCYVCPWDAIAGWLEKPRLRPDAPGLGLARRWPRRLRNLWPAVGLFVVLTWFELGADVESRPWAAAAVGATMLALTIALVFLFERRAFCRYVCSVGGVTGLWSQFAATEVRAAEPEVCVSCRTKDCHRGNQWGVGCPTDLFPATFSENTHCITCMECVKTCPFDVMTVRARPWGADLAEHENPRLDEAFLALVILAFTFLSALRHTPEGLRLAAWLEEHAGPLAAVGAGMLAAVLAVAAIFGAAVALHRRLAPTPHRDFAVRFVELAYGLVPLALFLHLAVHLGGFVARGRALPALLAPPQGADPAGAVPPPDPLLSPVSLWLLQTLAVLAGSAFALRIVDRRARSSFGADAPLRARLPLAGAVVLFGLASLWILARGVA